MLTILILLSVAYIVLKTVNTRAEFARRDAEREAREAEAAAAAEEAAEDEMIRAEAVDVDAEVIPETDE
jgi:hypothetical protein